MGQIWSTKRPRSKPQADYCCKMRVNITKITYIWEIENFSHCPKQTGEELLSETFPTKDSKDKWCLKIYARGCNEEKKHYVSLFLKLVESDRENVGAKLSFSLKGDTEEHSYRAREIQHNFGDEAWGLPQFIKRSYLLDPENGLLPDDKLTIVCSMTVAGDTVIANKLDMSGFVLGNKINHEFGDFVTLSVGGKRFNVYKAILSAHSPVFSAMLKHNTKESQTAHIVIEDTEPEVMKEMLHFIHTGSAPNLPSMADQLLLLADKYQVEPLKLLCEEAMGEQLSVENSCAILVQSDRISAARLKSYAVKFMIAQAAAVSKSKGFKLLVRQYPQLLIETFQTMAALQFKP